MRVLFVGGTGLISGACTALALERGFEVTHLNRGFRQPPPGVRRLVADARDEAAVQGALAGRSFEAVVDWIGFHLEDVERDLRLFRDRTGQFVFVSSATVYQKPLRRQPIREDSPLGNPYWEYARDKLACEARLLRASRDEGFPVTIVRPSHTYGDGSVPLAVRSLDRPFTSIVRLRAGKPLIVPGDGTSLWTLTHTSDFAVGLVGLLGRPEAIGDVFNITSDEALPWDEIYRQVGEAAGASVRTVHMTSDFIAACLPELRGRLLGDASTSLVFDTAKLRRLVPEFRSAVALAEGLRRSVAWFDADQTRQQVDAELDARWDRLISAYEAGLKHAESGFNGAR